MDGFFATVPIRRKTRVHFHAFMRDVHEDLARHKREPDPLAFVAARIARRSRLVCFDEFHVSDIADAMILGRLLGALFEHGVVFVLTTNYAPDALWPNGLQRERFLPTIALLKQWLDVVGGRRRHRLPAAGAGAGRDLARASRARLRSRPGVGVRGDAVRPGRGPEARRSKGGRSSREAPRRQRRLVRLRDAVRRPPLAAGLPRARLPVFGAVPLRHPPAEPGHGGRGAALHLARRHTVRSPREASGLRRGPSGRPLPRGAEPPGVRRAP